MAYFKIPSLKAGDIVGLISPAGPVEPQQIETGLAVLEKYGFQYRFGKNAFANHGITSAPAGKRLEDITGFLKDEAVKAIWALRGGYGSMQLFHQLDFSLFLRYPKIFVGFSDLTALAWAIFSQARLPTVSGFTLTTQLREENPYLQMGMEMLTGKRHKISRDDLSGAEVQVFREGEASGTLIGGTLSMICALGGTPFLWKGKKLILLIEDVNEPLYRIDKYLQQLSFMGFWERVTSVILGQFLYQEKKLDIVPHLLPLIPASIPVVTNFPYGHVTTCCPIPVGIPGRIKTNPFELLWKPFII